MQAGSPALVTVDEALREVSGADHVLVDMHAEATSEKVALGWYLDGKVTARRRHPHARPDRRRPRAPGRDRLHHRRRDDRRARRRDRRRREQSIAVMRTHMPMRYDSADEDPWINAVLIRCSQPRRADSIEQILRPAPG